MIVTVTPNPALDITYRLGDGLAVGRANRVVEVSERAGGKGLNVARVLVAHGAPVVALGLLGGATGDAVRAGLDAAGVAHDFTPIAGGTRRTVVIVPPAGAEADTGDASVGGATGLWEPGPTVSGAEWGALRDRVRARLDGASVLVLAGSLPPGAPVDGYAELIALAHAARVPTILDADGDALRHGLSARPTAAKPNAAELTALTGHPVTDPASALEAIRAFRAYRAYRAFRAVKTTTEVNATAATAATAATGPPAHGTDLVVSLGPAGLLAVTSAGTWSARPPAAYLGNATGAGDAAVAALALGLRDGDPWPARLARMVAWSAAAAAHPVAGEFDPALAVRLHAAAIVAGCESR